MTTKPRQIKKYWRVVGTNTVLPDCEARCDEIRGPDYFFLSARYLDHMVSSSCTASEIDLDFP